TAVIITRDLATASYVNASISLVEFNPSQVRVQNGTFAITSGSLPIALAQSVNTSRAALVFYYESTLANDNYDESMLRGNITNSTHLTIDCTIAITCAGKKSGSWYVFESLNGEFTVQKPALNFRTTDTLITTTIASVNTSRTFLIASWITTETSDDPAEGSASISLINATAINGTRIGTTAQTLNATVFVVTFADGGTSQPEVQRGTFSYPNNVNASVVATINAVNLSVSTAWSPGNGKMISDSAADASESAFQRLGFANSTAIRGTRNESTGFGLGTWEVIEWSAVSPDTENPVSVFGTNPADNVNRSNTSVTFDLKGYDNIALSYLSLYGNWTGSWLANQTNTSPINDTYWNITVDAIPQGKWIWAVWTNDTTNNQNLTGTNRTITIDTVAPTISLPFYANATIKASTETLTLNISVADATTNPSACKIDANGTNLTVSVSSGWCNTTSVPLTNLAEGNRTINVYANDSTGQFGLNNSYVVKIVNNAAPTIPFVQAVSAQDPLEAGYRSVLLNFSVNDTDGSGTINLSSARARFNRTGEPNRENFTCANIGSGGNGQMFTCNVSMYYYDELGAWTINVSARDNSEASAENSTTNFTYNLLTAIVISPTALTWPSPINLTDTNISSNNDPITINNTGNSVNSTINLTAYNLRGETTTTQFIFANNFTIGNVTDGCGAGINASIMTNATSRQLNGTNFSKGNNSLNYGNQTSGQEQIFFCLRGIPQDITAQSYSSSFYGAWEIRVLLAALIPGKKRKREKKKVEDDKLIKVLGLVMDEMKEEYSL
ncbi:hypothetical protein HYS50_02050, partial [Candidatus Woesearchaeota archaeon]|nr:hypothetical protein [Candidatus Woesearchaeota archaeon]